MASIQYKYSGGHKYWYIAQSIRVNGKPRPIVLEYLGKAETLLKRLRNIKEGLSIKSYAHGDVAALLNCAKKLDIATKINKYVKPLRNNSDKKPIRNNLTAGFTCLLAAIGRVSEPCSKNSWKYWVKKTSLGYLLRMNFEKVNSQHFWDLMEAFPEASIKDAEEDILREVIKQYNLRTESLLVDTTNFYTFISTTNKRCTIAKRGRNKQKRNDLRQIGLMLVATKEDLIPLFHYSYEGNIHDSKIFKKVIREIKERIIDLGLDIEKHTISFDRGNNSKKNLKIVKSLNLHYVGALSPYHHKELIEKASKNFRRIQINDTPMDVYREKVNIWGEERTVVIFISDRLKLGQIRGMYYYINKTKEQLKELKEKLERSRKKRNKKQLEEQINRILEKNKTKNLVIYKLRKDKKGKFILSYYENKNETKKIEDSLGFRIIMTDRHEWDAQEIINAFHAQSYIEKIFKEMKSPEHLSVSPYYHWTDHKIKIHNFCCVIGYLLASLIRKELKEKIGYNKNLDTLLDTLKNIRLAILIEKGGKKGRPRAIYKLEERSEEEDKILGALGISDFHKKKIKFESIGVYK